MVSYRDENEAKIDELCKPVPLAEVMDRVKRTKRTIDRWIKDGHLRVIHLENPPEDVVILRDLVETDKAMRDALAASKAAIAAKAGRRQQATQDPPATAS